MMNKTFLLMVPVGFVLITQFTNCSPFTQGNTSDLSSLGDLACGSATNCITPNAANLAVSPNLFYGTNFPVNSGLGDFNIAGDCNEGGFPNNTISWALLDSNNMQVRNSQMASADSQCVNGRFSVYVTLAALAGDNVNRTGLYTNGATNTRQQYTLQLQIFGQYAQGGSRQIGTQGGRNVVLTGI